MPRVNTLTLHSTFAFFCDIPHRSSLSVVHRSALYICAVYMKTICCLTCKCIPWNREWMLVYHWLPFPGEFPQLRFPS